jgi:molecular chaperone DnaJ
VVLHVKADERFERDGRNLISHLSITFAQAALGDVIMVPGVETEHDLNIPAGIQPGTVLSIRDAGMPPLHGGKRGDLLVIVQVAVPEKLTEAEAKHLKEFAEMRGERIPEGEQSGSIFGNLFGKKKK